MSRSLFSSPAWHAAMAKIIASNDDETLAGSLMDAVGMTVDHEGTCLLALL